MTLQVIAWVGLLLFGFLYNAHVGAQINRKRHDFMARFVALGCFIVVVIQTAAFPEVIVMHAWAVGAHYLIAFACGGLGMAWGSWQRRKLLDAEPGAL